MKTSRSADGPYTLRLVELSPLPSPQRHMSMDVSQERAPRKNSRYDFATEGEEESSLPSELSSLVTYKSLLAEGEVVSHMQRVEHLGPLLAPNSPDKDWVLTVVNNRKRSSSGVVEDTPQTGRLLFSDSPPMRNRSSTGPQTLV